MLILYYSPGACSLAAHILLEETHIPFEARRVSIPDGEHRGAAYSAINPRQRIPAMVIEGTLVTEVPALLSYIASLCPEAKLVPPPGTLDYVRCLEFCAFLSSSLHILYAQFRRPERFLPADFPNRDAFIEQGRLNTVRCCREVEDRLGSHWVNGEHYTIADAYLFPFYFWGPRVGLDMASDCPRWTAWKDRMVPRPAVQRAVAQEGLQRDWEALLAPAAGQHIDKH
jgi:glutathione S-transferase